MKNILAVDTATQMLIVSVKKGDSYYSEIIDEGFTHSENIIPAIDKTLIKADLKITDIDLLVCSRGPGSFTGLRISMSTLKGISSGLNIPLVSVPTLDIYSKQCDLKSSYVLPLIDARKKRYYCALFLDNTKLTEDLDLTPEEIAELLKDKNVVLTGPDYLKVKDILSDRNSYSEVVVDYTEYSKNIITLGLDQYSNLGEDKIDQGPVYIRKSEAEIHLENKKSH